MHRMDTDETTGKQKPKKDVCSRKNRKADGKAIFLAYAWGAIKARFACYLLDSRSSCVTLCLSKHVYYT